MADIIVYGIRNCDTVKKALMWLDKNKIPYSFHDFKSKGVPDSKLKDWSSQLGWETLLNRKGMTWRQLDEKIKQGVTSASSAMVLMKEKTSVIKRPLIEKDGNVLAIGFDPKEYDKLNEQK